MHHDRPGVSHESTKPRNNMKYFGFSSVRGWYLLVAVLTVVTTDACMVGPKYARPPVEQPAAFKSPMPASPERGTDPSREGGPSGDQNALPEEWWRLYQDTDLDRLIATANASNQTLLQA